MGVKPKGAAALVCGILAIVFGILFPLIGIILGIVAIVLSVKAVSQTGYNAKTKAGKICGIAGIAVGVIVWVISIVIGVGILASVAGYSAASDPSTSGSTPPATTYSQDDLTDSEKQCQAIAVQTLDGLKNQDPAVASSIAQRVDAGFEQSTGVSHADLGTSAEDLTRWMLTDFDYTLDGVYDNGDGTVTVYADTTQRDALTFMTTFYDDADAWLSSSEGQAATEAEQKAKLGEFYNDAMAKSTDMTTFYTALDFTQQNGQWTLDQSAWDDELSYMFYIYD